MKPRASCLVLVVLAAVSTAPPALAQRTILKQSDTLEALSRSFEEIADRVAPSVVQIYTSGYGVGGGHTSVLTKQQGMASGIIIDSDGYIVTNAHVVSGTRRIQVQLATKSEAAELKRSALRPRGSRLEAQVVGMDVATDLALLKIPQSGLPPLSLGDSDRLKQGQLVLAFGSPLGLGNTVTMGVVSAVARQLHVDDPMVYVQTDAPINPGNSGGPLVDSKGEVVGINTMIMSQSGGSEGLGLAIPSSTVRDIIGQLRANGRVRRGVIGIHVQTVNQTMATALGLPQAWGVLVADMADDGPAAKAGVEIGDVILSADGKTIENVRQFGTNLYRHAIDATVTLGVLRGADKLTLSVPVMERPDDPSRFLELADPQKNLVAQLDLLGIDVDENVASALPPLRKRGGVLVAAMTADAAPPGDRFLPGDVIHAVNRTPVSSLEELRAALGSLKDGDPVVVQIERQGSLEFVAFEVD
jgi:serine protease Do